MGQLAVACKKDLPIEYPLEIACREIGEGGVGRESRHFRVQKNLP